MTYNMTNSISIDNMMDQDVENSRHFNLPEALKTYPEFPFDGLDETEQWNRNICESTNRILDYIMLSENKTLCIVSLCLVFGIDIKRYGAKKQTISSAARDILHCQRQVVHKKVLQIRKELEMRRALYDTKTQNNKHPDIS